MCVCVCVCVCVYVCVCVSSHISPLERLLVLKLLSRTLQAMEVKKYVGFSLKPLHSKVMALFAYLRHPTAILQQYSAQLFDGRASKALNKANSRLNTTWNTTQCKAVSFCLFSLRLLLTNPQIFHVLSVTRISVARALFSAFISIWLWLYTIIPCLATYVCPCFSDFWHHYSYIHFNILLHALCVYTQNSCFIDSSCFNVLQHTYVEQLLQ